MASPDGDGEVTNGGDSMLLICIKIYNKNANGRLRR